MFKDLIEYIQKEWNTIRGAPFIFLILSALLCYVIYVILDWHYDERIKTLEAQSSKTETYNKAYIVKGTVKKEDGADPGDITITTQHPPLHPAYNGEIVGLEVRRGQDGRLPTLSFDRDRYTLIGVNLNDEEKALIGNDEIIIRNPIQLKLLTPTKDSQK
jgi:hypothetical protein